MAHLATVEMPDQIDWLRLQAARGQAYYHARLQRLGFRGKHVLDAGCGAGNWALALARQFEQVTALDNDPGRLNVVKGMAARFDGVIQTRLGSVEEIPFSSNTFDALFCNGVVFLTRYRRSLSEFARVLKPDAPMYVTYDGSAWWRHLLFERGRNEPSCILFGCDGRISLLFRLLDEIQFERTVSAELRERMRLEFGAGYAPQGFSSDDAASVSEAYRRFVEGDAPGRTRIENVALDCLKAGLRRAWDAPLSGRKAHDCLLCIEDLLSPTAPPQYRSRIARDALSRLIAGKSDYQELVQTHSHEPEQMTEELLRLGFHSIQSAAEGCLCLDASAPVVAPIFELRLGVFESFALAPSESSGARIDVT
jgi:SAM-dependent methyltransferase